MATYIAGAYSVDFGSAGGHIGEVEPLGQTENGFEVIRRPSFNVIRADETGRTPVNGIFTGAEDIIIRLELIEFLAATWAICIDWMNESGTEGLVEKTGQLMSSLADELVLTPITGPAATGVAGGKYTFLKAYPLEPVRSVHSAQRLRTTSLGFYIFASSVTSYVPTMYSAAYA